MGPYYTGARPQSGDVINSRQASLIIITVKSVLLSQDKNKTKNKLKLRQMNIKLPR